METTNIKERIFELLKRTKPKVDSWCYPLEDWKWSGWEVTEIDDYYFCEGVYCGWSGKVLIFDEDGELCENYHFTKDSDGYLHIYNEKGKCVAYGYGNYLGEIDYSLA